MAQISDLDVCIPGQIVHVERNGMLVRNGGGKDGGWGGGSRVGDRGWRWFTW